MYRGRSLSRADSRAIHAPTGSDNLTAAVNNWFELGPKYEDELWTISGVEVTLAGKDLLENLGSLGTADTSLEFRMMLRDGFGSLRDLNLLTLHTTETAAEWREGTHNGTVVDVHAKSWPDGTYSAGLRGTPNHPGNGVSWKGPENRLRYGSKIDAAVWDVDLVLDDAGNPLNSCRLMLRTGVDDGVGGINWTDHVVANNGQELAQGYHDFDPPIAAQKIQWVAELAFIDADDGAPDENAIRRTSILLVAGEWIELASPVWRFKSLADLINQSDGDRVLRPRAWSGTEDTVILRLPMSMELDGSVGESLSVRLTSGGLQNKISTAHVFAVADVTFIEER